MNVELIPFFQGWSITERDDQSILPNEILIQIFDSLPVEDAISKGLVSYQFYCITKQKQQEVNIRLNSAAEKIIAYLQNSYYRRTKGHFIEFAQEALSQERFFKFDLNSFYEATLQDVMVNKIVASQVCTQNSKTIFFAESPNIIITEHNTVYYPGKLAICAQSNLKKELRLLAQHVLSIINQDR